MLIGGDAGMGHCVYPHVQYHLNGCCLRAPWIMEQDDFRHQLSFGDDIFGAVIWLDYVGEEAAAEYRRLGTVPIMLDASGRPVLRNFVHVEDLVSAILIALDHPAARRQTFNVCMDEPVDYGAMAYYLASRYGLPSVGVPTEFHSTWLDKTKAKFLLGWRPEYDMRLMIDAAWTYQRAADDPRIVWYPG